MAFHMEIREVETRMEADGVVEEQIIEDGLSLILVRRSRKINKRH